jgi:hypothetical protein
VSDTAEARHGWTVREFSRLVRMSKDRVRAMIRAGQLGAINTAPTRCGRPRFIILPGHLAEFERARRVSPPPKAARRRQQRRPGFIDFYPD